MEDMLRFMKENNSNGILYILLTKLGFGRKRAIDLMVSVTVTYGVRTPVTP